MAVVVPQEGLQRGGIVELRIPGRADWAAVARLAVAAVANRLPFSIEEIEDIKLAIAEACTNAIQHSVEGEPITILCEASEDSLRLTISHHGLRMQPGHDAGITRAEAPDDYPGEENLGVFLIRALMDEVEHRVDPTLGVHLVMTKRVGR